MGILNINLNIINLDKKFDEDGNDTITFIRLLPWNITFEKRKFLKKELNEELMPIVWRSNRLQDWCQSEDEKEEIDPIFIEEL